MTESEIGALDNLRAAKQSVQAALLELDASPAERVTRLLLGLLDVLDDASHEVRVRAMEARKGAGA